MGHHFVLIHGGCHGAWAWFKLQDRLQRAGHKVTAMDLAGAGIHPADPDTITTYDEYNAPAINFFTSLPEDEKVVLVGHSMAGLGNLQLMEKFYDKIGLAIFVAAVMTASGLSAMEDLPLIELMSNDAAPSSKAITFNFKNGAENPPTSFYYPESKLKEIFYNDCDPEDIVLASKLVRPYPTQTMATPITYTKERHGQVPAVYIRYSQDNTFPPQAQEYVVNHYGPFKEVVELDGGHFNFWPRVDDFTKLIVSFAEKYTGKQD